MRTVGCRRSEAAIEAVASAAALRRGLEVVDAAASFGWAPSTGQRKGVYRFRTFEAMDQHRLDALAQAMAERTRSIKQSTRPQDIQDAIVLRRAVDAGG